MPQMELRHMLEQFKRQIGQLYGERLKKVILYGSFARQEGTDDSDIDLAVVLEGEVNPIDEIDRMIDVVFEINLANNVLISIYPVSEEKYRTVNSPLLVNLRREGIAV